MTDEQMNRAIALHLGWKMEAFGITGESEVFHSPRCGFEEARCLGASAGCSFDEPNFLTDPAMTLLLMEKLVDELWHITFFKYDDLTYGLQMEKEMLNERDREISVESKNYGDLIPLAFLKSHNLEAVK